MKSLETKFLGITLTPVDNLTGEEIEKKLMFEKSKQEQELRIVDVHLQSAMLTLLLWAAIITALYFFIGLVIPLYFISGMGFGIVIIRFIDAIDEYIFNKRKLNTINKLIEYYV